MRYVVNIEGQFFEHEGSEEILSDASVFARQDAEAVGLDHEAHVEVTTPDLRVWMSIIPCRYGYCVKRNSIGEAA